MATMMIRREGLRYLPAVQEEPLQNRPPVERLTGLGGHGYA
jgi:hypothetical protein